MKTTSNEICPPRAEKNGVAALCERDSHFGSPGQNGVRRLPDFPTAAKERHQSASVQRFLLEMSAEFVSRDYETTLKRLAVRAVPFFADFCFFDVLSSDGSIDRVAWAHVDPDKHRLFDSVREFVPTPSSAFHPITKVLRTGQADLVPEVTDAWMRSVATNQRHLEFMQALELRSLIAVPLLVPGRTLGVLTFCYSASSGRRYCLEDLWLAEDLAHRAAIVVENAGLYHELQDAGRRKDEFLAMLGHELRNPLAPIRTAMQIFRLKGQADPELHALTDMVDRQVQQLTRLVDDLLDVSRLGHGKINLRMKPVDLKSVVAAAIESSRPLIDARKHALRVSLPRQAVEVQGDAGRLVQVVANLLNNSAKYSDDGGRIDLTMEVIGELAVMRVRDMGIGIDPAILPTIFDLFTQVSGSTSRSESGLGIGLALVRKLVELHGGCVQAVSAGLGHGTELVVRLPLFLKVSADHASAPERPWSAMNAPPRRILLIDDNRDAADSMAMLLRFAGHEVRTAYDGQTALALARLEPPEVVICDICMPGMCGFELGRLLRQDLGLRNTLLVALSGYAQDEDQRRSQEAGFNAHLPKPVRLDSLNALLANVDLLTVGSPGVRETMVIAP
jgi:signal transduction histidine kinase/CheY-like chemotaxis protein